MIQTGCARMLMRVKVSPHVEIATLLEWVRNAKEYIQLGIDAEDYYRIKNSEKKME